MFVTVVAYGPEWEAAFQAEAAAIRDLLDREFAALFHISSTTIPSLRAKSVIDMLAVVASVTALDAYAGRFDPWVMRPWASSAFRADDTTARAVAAARTRCMPSVRQYRANQTPSDL